MKEMVRVDEEGDGYLYVTFKLSNRWELWRLSTIMTAAAARQSCTKKEAYRWRRAGRDLKEYVKAIEDYPGSDRGRVKRPPSEQPSEFDRDHVLNGHAPYPVLSPADMAVVYPLLEARGMSSRDIGERLHISWRTITRWRKNGCPHDRTRREARTSQQR